MTDLKHLYSIESEDKEKDDGGFIEDYNSESEEEPFIFRSWEDGDKGRYFKHVDDPAYGYWEDYYNDQEYADFCGESVGVFCIDINFYYYADRKEYFTAKNKGYWTVIEVPNDTIASDIGLKINDKIRNIIDLGKEVILQVRRGHMYLDFIIEKKRITPFYIGTR